MFFEFTSPRFDQLFSIDFLRYASCVHSGLWFELSFLHIHLFALLFVMGSNFPFLWLNRPLHIPKCPGRTNYSFQTIFLFITWSAACKVYIFWWYLFVHAKSNVTSLCEKKWKRAFQSSLLILAQPSIYIGFRFSVFNASQICKLHTHPQCLWLGHKLLCIYLVYS